jgi:annexin A7/11
MSFIPQRDAYHQHTTGEPLYPPFPPPIPLNIPYIPQRDAYHEHAIGAPLYPPFPPPIPYMPQRDPAMPDPYAGTQQSFAYSPVPSFPSASQPIYPSHHQWYLGTEVPPLHLPQVPQGVLKVPGYDPKGDAQTITTATKGRTLDKKEKEMRAYLSSET